MSTTINPSTQYQGYNVGTLSDADGNAKAGGTTTSDGTKTVGAGHHHSGHAHVPSATNQGATADAGDITTGTISTATMSNADAIMGMVSQLTSQLWTAPLAEIDALARVVIEEAAAQSRATLDQSRQQADAAKAQLMQQAATLRQEASQMMSGAIASLVMTVVSSAISIGSALKQTSMLSSVEKPVMGEDVGMNQNAQSSYQTEMQKVNSQVGALNMATSGITQLVQGIGSLINTAYQADAKETEAKSAENSANAQQLQSFSDQSQKISQDLGKLADQIIAVLKEINDAKAQMMQAMTRV